MFFSFDSLATIFILVSLICQPNFAKFGVIFGARGRNRTDSPFRESVMSAQDPHYPSLAYLILGVYVLDPFLILFWNSTNSS